MAGGKRRRDVIHDHQVECFALDHGLTSDEAWELILKHGNNRETVFKAAQALRGDDGPQPTCPPLVDPMPS
jgi:hypothetical protein